ncbi:DUF2125 domain-containing protein, partial [Falsiroseomonas oryziterrae]|uniref:DUF2125 domain-containing protein n=1 Tax=Falsiroseomonas oryziterrae TaxID=2911368 RepID=UPI001F2B6986
MDRKPPRRLRRNLLLAGLATLLALGGGHTLLWRTMAAELEAGWRDWAALRRSQGWRVDTAPPVRGGWPLAATLTLDRVRLEGATATLPGGMTFSTDRLVLRVALPRLDRLVVELPGQQRLRLGAAELPFTADALQAVLPLQRGTPPSSLEASAERLRIGSPLGGFELRSARLSLAGSASATEEEAALAFSFGAEGVELPSAPAGAAGAFGRRVESVAAELMFSGPVPPGRVPAQRAEAWRDGGGT